MVKYFVSVKEYCSRSLGAENHSGYGWRLCYRLSPEVTHILDFSFIEINKTGSKQSRACKFERRKEETLARVQAREQILMMSQASHRVQARKEESLARLRGRKTLDLMSQAVKFEKRLQHTADCIVCVDKCKAHPREI